MQGSWRDLVLCKTGLTQKKVISKKQLEKLGFTGLPEEIKWKAYVLTLTP